MFVCTLTPRNGVDKDINSSQFKMKYKNVFLQRAVVIEI